LAWSSVGASTLLGAGDSFEVVLVREDTGLSERLDIAEIWDISEELEPLRPFTFGVDDVRSGSAGAVLLRLGKDGGSPRAVFAR
jgi:hypothetical protein